MASQVLSARLNPTRDAIVIVLGDMSSPPNPSNVNAIATNPTWTLDGVNQPALSNPIWGATPDPNYSDPYYLPYIYYRLGRTLQATDTVTLTAPDGWATATAGACGPLTNLPVTHVGSTLLPPFVPSLKTMGVGYNLNFAEVYFTGIPVYINFARRIQSWGDGIKYDSLGYPTAPQSSVVSDVIIVQSNTDSSDSSAGQVKGYYTVPNKGRWTLQWDGPATDPADSTGNTPILQLTNANNVAGLSINEVPGSRSLTGTTNNTIQYDITQTQGAGYPYAPNIFLHVSSTPFNTAFSNLRIYPPDPADTTFTKSLDESKGKFHPSFLKQIQGAKCIRFMQWIDILTGQNSGCGGDIIDFADFRKPAAIGDPVAVGCSLPNSNGIGSAATGVSLSRIDPYNDTEGYFVYGSTAALLTFSGPHGARDSNFLALYLPGPGPDNSLPTESVATIAGTVTIASGSVSVTGIGTNFQTDLAPGQRIMFAGDTTNGIYPVKAIGGPTSLTLASAYGGPATPTGGVAVTRIEMGTQLAGTVSLTPGSAAVTGSGTAFGVTRTPWTQAVTVTHGSATITSPATGPNLADGSISGGQWIEFSCDTPRVPYQVASVVGNSDGSSTLTLVMAYSGAGGTATISVQTLPWTWLTFPADMTGTPYQVLSVADDTHLTLTQPYGGPAPLSAPAYSHFSVVRLNSDMSWMVRVPSTTNTIGTHQVAISIDGNAPGNIGRVLLGGFSAAPTGMTAQNTINPGAAPLDTADLCNAAGADLWLSLPFGISNDGVSQLITNLGKRLNRGLKIWLEYANECWNWTYPDIGYCYGNSALRGIGFPQGLGTNFLTERSAECHNLAVAALNALTPPRGGDLVRVFGTQGANSGVTADIVAHATAKGYTIDCVAGAPYFNNAPSRFPDPSESMEPGLAAQFDACSADQLLDLGELNMLYGGFAGPYIADHYAALRPNYPNAKVVCYEGGPQAGLPSTLLNDPAKSARSHIWTRHPRFRGIMLWFLQSLNDAGCTLFNNYQAYNNGEDTIYNWAAYFGYGQPAGLGDGSDGHPDNRKCWATNPIVWDYTNTTSVVGGAINYWNSLTTRINADGTHTVWTGLLPTAIDTQVPTTSSTVWQGILPPG